MQSNQAHGGAGGYQLKSELARVCLPAPQAHTRRRLAWTNSIALVFLIVGVAGARVAPPPAIPVQPLEEAAPVIIETPPPPATPEPPKNDEATDQDKSAAPRLVVVTPDSPAIKFSVPTIGNVVVPNAVAVAPVPFVPSRPRARAPAPAPLVLLNNTGEGGDRPEPSYPRLAQELRQQGSVVLLMTADEAGVITAVEIAGSSGSPILDHAAVDFVKNHWTVAPGARGRRFQATIKYQLN